MSIKLTAEMSVPAASAKLVTAGLIGLVAGLVAGMAISWKVAPLVAWDTAAAVYMLTTWRRVLRFGPSLAAKHALREDPSRAAADAVLLGASIASLAAVGLVLMRAQGTSGAVQLLQAALGLASVVVSWGLIHTVYALRYAELYYHHAGNPIDFGDTKTPIYADFAYLAFTLGMTFQVSDTMLRSAELRRTALRHALLSYLFGTIIIATTINLIAGLGK